MRKKLLVGISLIAATVLTNSAQAFEVNGTKTSSVVVTNQTLNGNAKKEVYLMNVKMTAAQKQQVQNYNPKNHNVSKFSPATLPTQVDQGMNGVPVLDQGRHGSCVTFANTAALDAMLGKGDYISQLCSLELGSYLEKKGYLPSGWDGSSGPVVLNQFIQFGLINKEHQRTRSCSGVKEYPTKESRNTGNPMTADDYRVMSENLIENGIYWQPMLDFYQRFDAGYDGEKLLTDVKKILFTGSKKDSPMRVTFGTLLPVSYCSAGACARFHATNDTWALTKAIEDDQDPEFGGHEMIITAYDDNAVAVDQDGVKHQGLLTLRNSWGSNVGDQGNYYMTYDFFKKFAIEVQAIKVDQEQASH